MDGKDVVEFRPTGMTITAPLLQELVLKRVASLVGGLDLSILLKLRMLNLVGTMLSSVVLPATEFAYHI